MPQMFPLYWLILFILFSIMLSVSLNKLFYLNNPTPKIKNELKILTTQSNLWKW